MKKIVFIIVLVLFVGCSTSEFKKTIEKNQLDLLSEESFMRYNNNRFSAKKSSNLDFISMALVFCHEGKIAKGLESLEEKMQLNKANPFYWNALGTCYFLKKDTDKAIFYYQLGLEATRDSNKAFLNDQKKMAEAVIVNNLGLIHLNLKRFDEAFDSFNKAHLLAPYYFTPHFNMAQLYLEFDENEKALKILTALEQKNANDVDLLYSLSLVYFKLQDLDKSFFYVSKIDKDYISRPHIAGLYAYNLLKKNRLDEAHEIMAKRLYANEYNKRNEIILEEINEKIKEVSETKTNSSKK